MDKAGKTPKTEESQGIKYEVERSIEQRLQQWTRKIDKKIQDLSFQAEKNQKQIFTCLEGIQDRLNSCLTKEQYNQDKQNVISQSVNQAQRQIKVKDTNAPHLSKDQLYGVQKEIDERLDKQDSIVNQLILNLQQLEGDAKKNPNYALKQDLRELSDFVFQLILDVKQNVEIEKNSLKSVLLEIKKQDEQHLALKTTLQELQTSQQKSDQNVQEHTNYLNQMGTFVKNLQEKINSNFIDILQTIDKKQEDSERAVGKRCNM